MRLFQVNGQTHDGKYVPLGEPNARDYVVSNISVCREVYGPGKFRRYVIRQVQP